MDVRNFEWSFHPRTKMSTRQWNVQEQLQTLDSDKEDSPFLAVSVPPKRRWVQARKLIQTDDWWSVWIGFSLFGVSLGVAAAKFKYPDFDAAVLPSLWSADDTSKMFTITNGVGLFILVILRKLFLLTCQVVLSFLFALLQFFFIQKGKPVEKQVKLKYYAPGFLLLELISVGIQILSSNTLLDQYGLKEEIWAFIIGIVLGNLLSFVNGKRHCNLGLSDTGRQERHKEMSYSRCLSWRILHQDRSRPSRCRYFEFWRSHASCYRCELAVNNPRSNSYLCLRHLLFQI